MPSLPPPDHSKRSKLESLLSQGISQLSSSSTAAQIIEKHKKAPRPSASNPVVQEQQFSVDNIIREHRQFFSEERPAVNAIWSLLADRLDHQMYREESQYVIQSSLMTTEEGKRYTDTLKELRKIIDDSAKRLGKLGSKVRDDFFSAIATHFQKASGLEIDWSAPETQGDQFQRVHEAVLMLRIGQRSYRKILVEGKRDRRLDRLIDQGDAIAQKMLSALDEVLNPTRERLRQGSLTLPEMLPSLLSDMKAEKCSSKAMDLVTEVFFGGNPALTAKRYQDPCCGWYQATSIEKAVEGLSRLELTEEDHLIELGAGRGVVTILADKLTSVGRITALECDEKLAEECEELADSYNCSNITTLRKDVRTADLSKGTAFYLFNSFAGEALTGALKQIEGVYQSGTPVRIISIGASSQRIEQETWLSIVGEKPENVNDVRLFHSVS